MSRTPRRLLAGGILVAALAAPALGAEPDHRLFQIRYKPPEDAVQIIRPLLGPDGAVTLQPRLRTVTVTDERPRLERIARAVQAFDVPPRNVNLAVQLLVGTQRPDAAGEDRRVAGKWPVVPGVDTTVRDALGVTSWNDYRLLGSASLTAAEGEESTLSLGEDYRIRFEVDSVHPDQSVTRFQRFALERRHVLPDGTREFHPIWDTVLNLKDNQLYLFGATRLEDSRRAVFLSITAGIVR